MPNSSQVEEARVQQIATADRRTQLNALRAGQLDAQPATQLELGTRAWQQNRRADAAAFFDRAIAADTELRFEAESRRVLTFIARGEAQRARALIAELSHEWYEVCPITLDDLATRPELGSSTQCGEGVSRIPASEQARRLEKQLP